MARAKKATAAKRSPKPDEQTPEERDAWIIAEQQRILSEADSSARALDKVTDDDVPPAPQATDDDGNVRPADARYLTDDQVAEQAAYVEEHAADDTKAAQEILAESGSSAVPSTDDDQEALPNV